MAGEPILIVDDTPVNLKLTRILLVNEGYKVLTAGSAEEALELLRSYHPLLILADIQLPGIDGLEMTRRIKRDERTRDIIVVALTASAMEGDAQRAGEAGCDAYITKPIDTRALGGRIRELLDLRAESTVPARAPDAEREIVPAAEIQALRRQFLSEGEERARRMLVELDGAFQAAEAARTVHQWIGTGGLLGYSSLARLAREVETLLHERPVDAAQVRESLTNLVLAFTTPREAHDTPIPDAIMGTLGGKRVALVGLPAPETQRICAALEQVEAHPQFFDLASSPQPAQLENCDLLVTFVRPESVNCAWLDPKSAAAGRPTVFVGSRDDLLALDPAVEAMAGEILMDSWQPDEALVRLSLALNHKKPRASRASPAPAGGSNHVLIADGDARVRDTVRTVLQKSGLEVHEACNGPEALEIAHRVKPQAAVANISLSGMNDYQLLPALRAENAAMRIILLTERQREREIIRGFQLGADDYVVKPFSPMELAARVNRLMAR